MRVGIAADHGGFALKGELAELLRASGYAVEDFGAHQLNPGDDYPDFIIPLAARLQDEGAKSFVKSWNELMGCIAFKSEALK